jgi:hypothetical protein
LQVQIADELAGRQDLLAPLSDSDVALSPIKNAIQTSIAFWERERFYFNELVLETLIGQASYPLKTVYGQEYYGAADYAPIPMLSKIDKMWVLINQNRYPLIARQFQYMVDLSTNPIVVGYPVDYAYAGEMLRFYPVPDGAYPVGMLATQRLSALVNDNDANAWTQDAFDLIRCDAKRILAEEVLYDNDIRDNMILAIYGDPRVGRKGYLSTLRSETNRRRAMGKIRPTHF